MRKVLILVGLAAVLGVSQVGSAGATEVRVPAVDQVCKTAFLPATVDAGVAVQKKITLAGIVLTDQNVNQRVIKVFKTVAVRICVQTEGDVVANVDLETALNGVAECEGGAVGAAIDVPLRLNVGAEGGAVRAIVQIAVHDKDEVAGMAFDDLNVVIDKDERIILPGNGQIVEVEDNDAVDAEVCVGPAELG